MLKKFLVIEIDTQTVVCEGSAKLVRDTLGISDSLLRAATKKGYTACGGKYRIIDLSDDDEPTSGVGMKEAADNWEKFCAPIRERYGIPVYKAPEVKK